MSAKLYCGLVKQRLHQYDGTRKTLGIVYFIVCGELGKETYSYSLICIGRLFPGLSSLLLPFCSVSVEQSRLDYRYATTTEYRGARRFLCQENANFKLKRPFGRATFFALPLFIKMIKTNVYSSENEQRVVVEHMHTKLIEYKE